MEALQVPFTSLSNVVRAKLEGTTVEEVLKNDEIAELRNEFQSSLSEITQQLQILSQAISDKSNVQDTQVPTPRTPAPQPPPTVQPAQDAKPGSLKAIIRGQYNT